MKRSPFFLLFIVFPLIHTHVKAQDSPERIFSSSRIAMTHSAELPYAGELHFLVSHRFGELDDGFYDLFGLDLATIRFGFDYGISDDLAAGIGRSTFEKTYDIFLKGAFLRQTAEKSPVALTGVFSASVNTLRDYYPDNEDNLWSRMTLSAQVIAARKSGIFSLQAAPLFMLNNYDIRSGQNLALFALPLGAGVKLSRRISFITLYTPVFNKPDFAGENPFSFGIDIVTSDHQFQLIFTNNRGQFDKSFLTNTEGEWRKGKVYFGFNLVREFELVNPY